MKKEIVEWVDRLFEDKKLASIQEYQRTIELLSREEEVDGREYLFEKARIRQRETYGTAIYIRGLLEISNYCKNNCYYCGIRKDNHELIRYRMTKEQIMECCEYGYQLGFRTFVLQGGEDPELTDNEIVAIVENIHQRYPDCAITLSLGEKDKESYQRYFDAGANRYLLRHETAEESHYRRLHPPALQWEHRVQCLKNLKDIGYQIGCGGMIGSPFQTSEHLAKDLKFIEEMRPHMVGIGPFISQKDTPFREFSSGSLTQTLVMLGLIRLILPEVLLPSTTALGTIHPKGREMGILAGANVVMPNISPKDTRKLYKLYDNKLGTGEESGEGLEILKRQMESIGYHIVTDRGDSLMNK